MTPVLVAILIGMLSGAVAALCGVGGGIIMVPAFVYFLGVPQKTAVATSLAAIVLTSVVATSKNHGNNFVDWKIAILSGVAAAVIAWFAADWLKVLSNATLTRIFAIVMILMGIRMLFQK